MANKQERDNVIQQVITLLYQAGTRRWSVQDKGVLVAAVKLQLQERDEQQTRAQGSRQA